MDERPAHRRGRAYMLSANEETLERLREFGRRGFTLNESARRLDVHPATCRDFLRREPAARQALEAGRAERRNLLLAEPPGKAVLPDLAPPGRGDTCPTCGGRFAENENSIVLTAAYLADARRRFEDLIDRHIAARRKEKPGRPDGDGTAGA